MNKFILSIVVAVSLTGCAGKDLVSSGCSIRASAIKVAADVNNAHPMSKKTQDEISTAIADTHQCHEDTKPTPGSVEEALFVAGVARLQKFLLEKK